MDFQECITVSLGFDLSFHYGYRRVKKHFRRKVLFGGNEVTAELHNISELVARGTYDLSGNLGSLFAGLTTLCH